MKNYSKFIKRFMESWKNLEGTKICQMFASDCEYYENPIDKPCTDLSQIKDLWAVVPYNQKNITYNGEILFENEYYCFYHFTMNRTMTKLNKTQLIDGIFQFSLNEKNLLTSFKQWRFTKEV